MLLCYASLFSLFNQALRSTFTIHYIVMCATICCLRAISAPVLRTQNARQPCGICRHTCSSESSNSTHPELNSLVVGLQPETTQTPSPKPPGHPGLLSVKPAPPLWPLPATGLLPLPVSSLSWTLGITGQLPCPTHTTTLHWFFTPKCPKCVPFLPFPLTLSSSAPYHFSPKVP